jgi:hypothetical protein
MPDGFPNAQLRHRFTVQGAASGSVFLDNIFFAPLPAIDDSRWLQLMPFGQRWRFMTNTPSRPTWYSPAFDDSAWPEAPAKFTAGTGPQNGVTPLPAQKPSYYFRRSFAMAQTNLTALLLAATCTDDYAGTTYPMRIWVNGTEVPGPVEAVSGEGNVVKYFDLTPFSKLFKHAFSNLIAVQLNNGWADDWDNVAFDISLIGIPETGVSALIPRFTLIAPSGGNSILLNMTAVATSTWMLESSGDLISWGAVAAIAFDGGGSASTTLPTQNNRVFYRLRSP